MGSMIDLVVTEREIRAPRERDKQHPWRYDLEALQNVLVGKIQVPHENAFCVECELMRLRLVRGLLLQDGEIDPTRPSRIHLIEERIEALSE